jgi:hypothetical protein
VPTGVTELSALVAVEVVEELPVDVVGTAALEFSS